MEPLSKRLQPNNSQQRLLMEKLDQWMQDKKIYKDPELNLDTLSEMTKISRHQISETLNQYLGKTYYAYINEYRIKEVIILLDKCKKQGIKPNILSIAFEMGFNSKSSFHLYFKKITGTTPSEYIKNNVIPIEKDAFGTEHTGFLNLNMN
jgi:AraC-like DNA-binding protein